MKTSYICCLSASDRFRIYKAVKAFLISSGCYSYTEMILALSGRVSDIEYML